MITKTIIIEDNKAFRESLSFIFSTTENFKVCETYQSVEEALQDKEIAPDVILLDINLPGMSGVEAIKPLKEKYPEIKIIILTVFEDDKSIFEAILNGADGYILKKTPLLRLIQHVEDVMQGGSPMSPLVAKKTLDLFKKFAPVKEEVYKLTDRETEILKMLVNGNDNSEIASNLFISIQTVRNHIRHIYEKLHVHSKSQAVVKAIKEGII